MLDNPQNPQYYFFLSYARGDDQESIARFFEDLSKEVRAHAGLASNAVVGFLDVRVEVGSPWSQVLMEAVGSCSTFLALVSPRYLLSEPCGREWTVFSDRLDAMPRNGTPPAALLPLLWLPPERLPEVVAKRQYQDHRMPEAYARAGLRQIIRLKRYHDDYFELLDNLARQIVMIAHTQPVPPSREGLAYDLVPSAFHTGERAAPAAVAAAEQVYFVVAAPSLAELECDELAELSRDPQFYGQGPQEWAPYRPGMVSPIVEYAYAIAVERQFQPAVTDIPGLIEWLEHTRDRTPILVLLVDPWSAKLSRHRRELARMRQVESEMSEALRAVMVPASLDDAQTQDHLDELMESLKEIPGWRTLHGSMFRTGILSPQAFDADLKVLLEGCRNRVFSTARFHRRPPGRPGGRPILRGP